ncbi:MAG: hypothetical protein L3J19_01585 [Sulfurimonas sp.]|nr:hypothetical protein [Sulfurimonas sp.]
MAVRLFLLSIAVVIMSGCAQKVNIRALEPAEIDRGAKTKKITVAPFRNDRVGLSNKIEANLVNKKINNKKYFTIVNRKDFDKIIDEQKIQNSGLIDVSTAVEVGNLIGAEAIISGSVGRVTSNDTYYKVNRVRCLDLKCKKFSTYSVRCIKRVIGLSAEIRMVDVTKGDIIYANTMSQTTKLKHCRDDSRALPSTEIVAQRLASQMAADFTYKLTPRYRYFQVDLLDEADIEYDDTQEKLLEVSIEYIKQNRYDKAQKFLIDLIDSTEQKSYVPFYNLGVIKEAQGEYEEAQKYYKLADDLVIEPVEEVSRAYIRIQSLIDKKSKTQEQLLR